MGIIRCRRLLPSGRNAGKPDLIDRYNRLYPFGNADISSLLAILHLYEGHKPGFPVPPWVRTKICYLVLSWLVNGKYWQVQDKAQVGRTSKSVGEKSFCTKWK